MVSWARSPLGRKISHQAELAWVDLRMVTPSERRYSERPTFAQVRSARWALFWATVVCSYG